MPADSQIGDYEIGLAGFRITPQPELGISRPGARPLLAAGKLIRIPPARPPKKWIVDQRRTSCTLVVGRCKCSRSSARPLGGLIST